MPQLTDREPKASSVEEAKLIEEIKRLIQVKGLNADDLKETTERTLERSSVLLSGCTRCTVCPCMICN
jgi:hypothetical protein